MMAKIVGKILILFLFFNLTFSAKVELTLKDMDGKALKKASIGEPFMLEVFIDGINSKTSPEPDIKGLDVFKVHNAGCYMDIINGWIIKKYKIRCDKEGEYTIGPATISVRDKVFSSSTKKIFVDAESVSQERCEKLTKQASPFLYLKLDKDEVFVGEKVKATLSFLYSDKSTSLDFIREPDFTKFDIESKIGPIEESKKIKGVTYYIVKWVFELCVRNDGIFLIPACSADYLVQKKKSRLSSLSLFFGSQATRKRAYSNAVRLKVLPLPPHNSPIDGIGSFSLYDLQVDQLIAKEGEGVVLRFTLHGDGNFGAIDMPVLENMPEHCRYYDSKSYLINNDVSGETGKCFEYIVQALEGRDLEIPSQAFNYFDVKTKTYKTVKSRPAFVSIIPAVRSVEQKTEDNIDTIEESISSVDNVKEENVDILRALNKSGSWYAVSLRSMSWKWFFMFIIFSLIYGAFNIIRGLGLRLNARSRQAIRKRKAFPIAKKQMKTLHGNRQLYSLFVTLFANRLGIPGTLFTQEKIKDILLQAGMSSVDVEKWNLFITRCAALVYSGSSVSENNDELFNQAQTWLERLEKIL